MRFSFALRLGLDRRGWRQRAATTAVLAAGAGWIGQGWARRVGGTREGHGVCFDRCAASADAAFDTGDLITSYSIGAEAAPNCYSFRRFHGKGIFSGET
jgi:hypothetical protein